MRDVATLDPLAQRAFAALVCVGAIAVVALLNALLGRMVRVVRLFVVLALVFGTIVGVRSGLPGPDALDRVSELVSDPFGFVSVVSKMAERMSSGF